MGKDETDDCFWRDCYELISYVGYARTVFFFFFFPNFGILLSGEMV